MKRLFFPICLIFLWLSCAAPNFTRVQRMPKLLRESSGILTYNGNTVWTHNDSGGKPALYEIDVQSGALLHVVTLADAQNIDWEDLTKDERGNIYIGDFGNNSQKRTDLCIYKIENPSFLPPKTSVTPERITFRYANQTAFPPEKPQQNFDCEAFVFYRDSLYLFSKNHTKPYNGYTIMYRLPAEEGDYTAEVVDSFYTGKIRETSWVTSAAISPNGKLLALLSSDKVWLFSSWKGADFFKGSFRKIALGNFSQKEAVCFSGNWLLWINDERTAKLFGGNLYTLDLR